MPTHEMEGLHYRVVGGHHAAQDTTPPTQVVQADYNSLYRGIQGLYLASGKTLLADGATDEAAGWIDLTAAFRRLDAHWTAAAIQMTASTHSLSPSADVSCFQILDNTNGPFASGIVHISQANSGGQDIGRFLLIENGSASRKFISGISAYTTGVWLEAGEACFFYGANQSGLVWQPVGRKSETFDKTFTIVLTGAASGNTTLESATASFQRSGKIVTLTIPQLIHNPLSGGPQALFLSLAGGNPLPAEIAPSSMPDGIIGTIFTKANGVTIMGYAYMATSGGGKVIQLYQIASSTFVDGPGGLLGQQISYMIS